MLKWGAYTMVFGVFMHANNLAHAGGFVSGALLGLCYRPARLAQHRDTIASRVMGVVGVVAILACVGLCLFAKQSRRLVTPPHASATQDDEWVPMSPSEEVATSAAIDAMCDAVVKGDLSTIPHGPSDTPEKRKADDDLWRQVCGSPQMRALRRP